MKEIKIIKGKFKGEIFKLEGTIAEVMGEDNLADLAIFKRNPAAVEALSRGYTINDEPFYYGKIGMLGFIISESELELTESDKRIL